MPDIEQASAPEKTSQNDRADNNSEKGASEISQGMWELMQTAKSMSFQQPADQSFGNAIPLTNDGSFGQSIPAIEIYDTAKLKSGSDAVEQKATNPQDAKANLTESLFNPNLSSQEKLTAAKELAAMGVNSIEGPDGKKYDIRTQKYGENTQVAIFGKGEDGKQHPFLRGVVDSEGNVRQQTDKNGRAVAFEGDWASKNSAENALISKGRSEDSTGETQSRSSESSRSASGGELISKQASLSEGRDNISGKQPADAVLAAIREMFPAGPSTRSIKAESADIKGDTTNEVTATAAAVDQVTTTAPAETQIPAPVSELADSVGINDIVKQPAQTTDASQSSLADAAGSNDIEKAATAAPAAPVEQVANNVKVAEVQLNDQTQKFEQNVQGQGFLGKSFDFLKNNIGSSSEGRAWYNPKAIWSNVIDSDNGSDAIRTKLDGIKTMISSARTDADTGNVDGANKKIDSLYTQTPDGTRVLQANNEVQKYDESQRNGVDTIATVGAVGTVALAGTGVGLAGIALGAAIGGGTKYLLKTADGNYGSATDLVTGGLAGAAPVVGRMAGAYIADTVTSTIGVRMGHGALSQLSTIAGFSTESGTIGGMTNAGQTLGQMTEKGASVSDTLTETAKSFGTGFGVGFVGGMAIGGTMQAFGRTIHVAESEIRAGNDAVKRWTHFSPAETEARAMQDTLKKWGAEMANPAQVPDRLSLIENTLGVKAVNATELLQSLRAGQAAGVSTFDTLQAVHQRAHASFVSDSSMVSTVKKMFGY